MSIKVKWLFCSILLLGVSFNNFAADSFSFSGYYKLFFTAFKMPVAIGEAALDNPPIGSVNNRLRFKLSYAPIQWLELHASYDISPRIQDKILFQESVYFSDIEPLTYRVTDFHSRILPGKDAPVASFGIYHNLDRFSVTLKTKFADIIVGRQAIAWGSGHVINPTDIIAPFTFTELDTEERRGVDAVRIRIPLGTLSELDLGYLPGDDFKSANSAFFLRGKTYFLKTDMSLLILGFRENLLLGLDVTRAIGGAGFWFEAAYVIPAALTFSGNLSTAEKNYFRLSTGFDYNFSGELYTYIEYHFNSAGSKDPSEYFSLFTETAFTDGAVYLMGKHYLNFGATYQLTPLVTVNGLVILNLGDHSFSFSPTLEYNLKEDIYFSAGAYLGIGKSPGAVLFRSEFGSYPSMFFTSFRVYF